MRNLILGILIGIIAVQCGRMQMQDELDQQQLYCQMVHDGLWGDYNDNYSEICPTKRHGKVLPQKGSAYRESYVPQEFVDGHQVF